ncbi:MAG: hypothetical protein AVDCRST_MAG48-1193, partial [uncultured Friedmanniella sp.]
QLQHRVGADGGGRGADHRADHADVRARQPLDRRGADLGSRQGL